MRFIAIASVVCASREIEPYDIAPVEKRLTIEAAELDLFERNRRAAVLLGALDAEEAADRQQVLGLLVEQLAHRRRTCPCALPRTACCSSDTVCGVQLCASPRSR